MNRKYYSVPKKIFNLPSPNFNLYIYLHFIIASFIRDGKKQKIIKKFFDLESIFRRECGVGLMKIFYFCFQMSRILLSFKLWNMGRKQVQLGFLPRNFFREEGRHVARFLVANMKLRPERTFLLRLLAEVSDILRGRAGGGNIIEKKKLYLAILNNKQYLRFLRFSKLPRRINKKKILTTWKK